MASDDHDDRFSRDDHVSTKTTKSVCGASTGTMFSMATRPKMAATPDWLVQHQRDDRNRDEDYLVSEASSDADDMSISDSSFDDDPVDTFNNIDSVDRFH